MSPAGWACFDTALGPCAVAWTDAGICNVLLPALAPATVEAAARRRWPSVRPVPPPASVAAATDAMAAVVRGEPVDLGTVVLDLRAVTPFERDVYVVARTIPPGRTATYGQVASRLGPGTSARAVGRALARNPCPIVVPCHRVVAAGGLGGFSAPGGADAKRRLLEREGAAPPRLFDDVG